MILKEHEAARWLTKEELDSVEWLPADITLIDKMKTLLDQKGHTMKSYLIKDTTKEERIALIRQWIPDDEAMEDCDIDLWDMYRDYINGTREIAEINAAFVE